MRTFLLLPLLGSMTLPALAQKDARDCTDHPLFARVPGFVIEDCSEDPNGLEAQIEPGASSQRFEGKAAITHYVIDEKPDTKPATPQDVLRNYETIVRTHGGSTLYTGSDDLYGGTICGTFTMIVEEMEYTVMVAQVLEPETKGVVGSYDLMVVSHKAVHPEVVMLETIKTKGSVALYINFPPGTADIGADSQAAVDQLVAVLKLDPALKVSIEGHTDNVGVAADNKKLSEQRAAAVMQAVVAKGIDPARMATKGWGSEKPAGDNDTEEGQAQNRRVEIVKL